MIRKLFMILLFLVSVNLLYSLTFKEILATYKGQKISVSIKYNNTGASDYVLYVEGTLTNVNDDCIELTTQINKYFIKIEDISNFYAQVVKKQ